MKRETGQRAFSLPDPLPAKRGICWSLFVCYLLLLACDKAPTTQAAGAKVFDDPAPPALQEPPRMEVPPPQPYPSVTFHTKPKPLPAGAITEDWMSFLGTTHNSVSKETKLLKAWPEKGPELVWEMVRGQSYASPAIAGNRLVYFQRLEDEEVLECLHPETGERYWRFAYPSHFKDRYGYNNGPRASPVIDEDRVYTFGAAGMLHCLKLDTGQLYWKRDILAEFHIHQDFFGVACTPLIEGDLLILNIGAPGGPCVAAFNKKDGKLVWGEGEEWGPSCSSPIPAVINGKRRVFVFAGGESRPPVGGLLCLDPATGGIDFSFPWRSKSVESVNASCPVVIGNQVFISASYQTGCALLNIQPDGTCQTVWTTKDLGTHFNTSVAKDGYLYGFDGRSEQDASLVCLEVPTGKKVWEENLEWEEIVTSNGSMRTLRKSACRGSLLSVDGAFLCLGELGSLHWLDLSPKGCKQMARAQLFDAPETWSLPVLSRGLLYVNQNYQEMTDDRPTRLLCYDLRGNE